MGIPVPDSGSVTEDVGVVGGFISTGGDIDYLIGDDSGDWTAETIAGAYGSSLTIDEDGVWTYTASNDHPSIDALDDGETLTEVFTVTSANGTSTITITINGTTDPPCFVAGTLIDTPFGPRPVEELRAGDLVLTRDFGAMAIRWVGGSRINIINDETAAKFQPVRLRANALGPGLPERDLLLSPMHRVLISQADTSLLFGESEVLCPAQALVNGFSITQDDVDTVSYYHILFDDHQVVTSSGCATESFYPGNVGLDGLGEAQREEMFALFPDLRSLPQSYGHCARMVLKGYEARLIRDRLLPEISRQELDSEPQSLWANSKAWIR